MNTPSFGYTCDIVLKDGTQLKGEVVSETGGFFAPVSHVGVQTDRGVIDVEVSSIDTCTCKA
mgnify:CR=1 FL=1